MKDFTYKAYQQLLEAYLSAGYELISYEQYLKNQPARTKLSAGGPEKFVILRHDVDKRPQNSLATAKIEQSLGATGSYYFRSVPQSFQPKYIKEIANLGHEIGYHYEEMSLTNGDYKNAFNLFQKNIAELREFYPVKTMCMHGSPLSKWDNKLLWKKYNYRDYGILAEPYFDIDFNYMLYITDTGRSWKETKANVRDKVQSGYRFSFSSTFDIIAAVKANELPNEIMQNIHPQRWNDNAFLWTEELILQNLKNVVKTAISK